LLSGARRTKVRLRTPPLRVFGKLGNCIIRVESFTNENEIAQFFHRNHQLHYIVT
jgi:hypothetical protein